MVVIRLARGGAKSRPFYHVVVTDSRSRRDGRFIERIGFFNPMAKGEEEYVRLAIERFDYWVGVGVRVSDAVKRLVDVQRQATDSSSKSNESVIVKKPVKARLKKSIKARQSEKTLVESVADTKPEKVASEIASPADKADDIVTKEVATGDTVAESKATQGASEEVLADRDVQISADAQITS